MHSLRTLVGLLIRYAKNEIGFINTVIHSLVTVLQVAVKQHYQDKERFKPS
jgi:hypothetical protein